MKTKKALSLFMVLALLWAAAPLALADDGLLTGDAENGPSSWAEQELQSLFERDIVAPELWSGYDLPISREEFTSMAVGVYEYINGFYDEAPSDSFTDIYEAAYKSDIEKAFNLGLINGRSETSFAPYDMIERQEAAKILCNVASIGGGLPISSNAVLSYEDSGDIALWALPFVSFASENNIMRGDGRNFLPKDYISREQAMAIFERMVAQYRWASALPQYRVLAVGIYDYEGEENDGERFRKGAEDFAAAMSAGLLNGIRYRAYSSFNLDRARLEATVEEVFKDAAGEDISIFMFTGHGTLDVPGSGRLGSSEPAIVLSDGSVNEYMSYGELMELLSEIKGTKLIILCSCYSGAAIEAMDETDHSFVITASTAEEESFGYENGELSYNEFDSALSLGLGYMEADLDGDGLLTYLELYTYLRETVELSTVMAESGSRDLLILDGRY